MNKHCQYHIFTLLDSNMECPECLREIVEYGKKRAKEVKKNEK